MPSDAESLYCYSRRHPAPKCEPVGSNRFYDVWDFDFKDGELIVHKVGQRDPNQDIQAAKGETLTEMLQRMPGKNPLAKVASAVASGLAPFEAKEDYKDISGIPDSVVETQEYLKKARANAAAMPKDLIDSDKDFKTMFTEIDEKKIMEWMAAKFGKKPATTDKEQDK